MYSKDDMVVVVCFLGRRYTLHVLTFIGCLWIAFGVAIDCGGVVSVVAFCCIVVMLLFTFGVEVVVNIGGLGGYFSGIYSGDFFKSRPKECIKRNTDC